jgi:hypothetical protein
VALVPPGVVTVTSTIPALWKGEVAVIWVTESTLKLDELVLPKLTAVSLRKFVPVIVTLVPPPPVPEAGEIEVTVGAAIKVYWSAALVALVPPVVVTVISTVPALLAGEVAVIWVAELTV